MRQGLGARWLILAATVGLLGAPSVQAAARLLGVELDAAADVTTVTLSLSAPVEQRTFSLAHPDRLVIDLRATAAGGTLALPAATGLVDVVRIAPQPHGTLRVVLSLNAAARSSLHVASRRGVAEQLDFRLTARDEPQLSAAAHPPVVVAAAHAPQASDRDIIVAVDAGHGGTDPGASGRDGTHEKDVVLAIAKALAERIDREPGMHAVLTRNSDHFIELRERMQIAHAAHADIFVSIHADAVRDRTVDGASVYVLSDHGASSEAAGTLADLENAADLKGVRLADKDQSLASVLLDVSLEENSIGTSVEVADRVLAALDRVGAVRRKQVQQAGFMVLKSPGIPSMLVETAYISNPAEERKLRSGQYQQRLADAIGTGLAGYFHLH
ncbi:MAG TPA: N-acetylmuramoyl-L-alanine amidase, partial [Steroidobacteraceae bacterium]|nr:N-acetylmuramoyl-L-alanine amidase [Steroidobacteraceae bacterium]